MRSDEVQDLRKIVEETARATNDELLTMKRQIASQSEASREQTEAILQAVQQNNVV